MRNLYLFFTCIFLIILVYFVEEKKQISTLVEDQKRSELFSQSNLGDVKNISGRRFKIESSTNGFRTSDDFSCSDEKVELYLSQFQSIKVQRILNEEEIKKLAKFSSKAIVEFNFENGHLKIEIGEKIQFNTSFYIKVTNLKNNSEKLAIATYENTYNQKFNINGAEDAYRSSAPYDQLLTIFGVDDEFFYNLNPFKDLNIGTVKLKTFRSSEYLIDLSTTKTTPEIYNGLNYNVAKFQSYSEVFTNFMAKKISEKSFELRDKLGEITIKEDIFTVFKKYGAKIGYFIFAQDKVYEIGSEDFRNLFSPYQEFWIKKLDFNLYDLVEVINTAENSRQSIKLSKNNYWGRLLLGQAHNVREHIQKNFNHSFIVNSNKRTYLVGQSYGGIEVLDKKNNLIFQFLEKLQ